MSESRTLRTAVKLESLWEPVRDRHRHIVAGRVNDHEIKIAVNEDPSEWHEHPNSDEFFLTLEGELRIEFRDGEPVILSGRGDRRREGNRPPDRSRGTNRESPGRASRRHDDAGRTPSESRRGSGATAGPAGTPRVG